MRRISLGGQLARVTHAAIRDRMREMLDEGSLKGLKAAAPGKEIDALLAAGADGGTDG